ncbi:type IV secretion system protein [Bartonella sp. CB189]|uniref:type IV secretion system protein n=1 Tax=Bartonella sp. CB189 TaxID=3112254 RepID=UPI002F96CA74
MKKLVLSLIIATISVTPSSASWVGGAGAADLGRSTPSSDWLFPSGKALQSTPVSTQREIINLIKRQLNQSEKIYKSITSNRTSGSTSIDKNVFFLKNPELIYDRNKNTEMLPLLDSIAQNEENYDSVHYTRSVIKARSEYAALMDKAISLQAFEATESRFNKIMELINKIESTKDLKDISELQAHIKAQLAMIQNESTKLQMVAHLRNAERELINQQKNKRNIKILNSKNTTIPTIRLR